MKKVFQSFLFTFTFFQILTAQDTLTVQTFTWDSTRRAAVFQFPDDGADKWEKVLMLYNMRCHDARIGGCAEWDYSCNTFITDSSRVDSTRLTHPSHLIYGYDLQNGPNYRFSRSSVHTYTQFRQHKVSYGPGSETNATIGPDRGLLQFFPHSSAQKAQFLYTAAEIRAAGLAIGGKITGLKLNFHGQGTPMSFLKIKMKNTGKTFLDPKDPEIGGFTEVYFLNPEIEAMGLPVLFRFYNDFNWDGVSNVIVEFTCNGTDSSSPFTIAAHTPSFNAGIFSIEPDNGILFQGGGTVNLPKGSLSSITNEITVSLWVYGDPDRMPTASTIFEGKDAAGNRQVNVHLPWSNERVYWDCGNDGTGYDRIDKAATIAEYEGKWHHWAFTKNAATGEMKIYLDGALWHSGTGKTKPINISDFSLGSAVTWSNFFYGTVDDLQIWNKELDEATIRNWMNRPLINHPNSVNLVAHYRLDEGAGLTTADYSANAQTARLIGSPAWATRRGEELFKNFYAVSERPAITFVRGTYTRQDEIIEVRDSVQNPANMLVTFRVRNNRLEVVDTQFVWDADRAFVYDEDSLLIDFVDVPVDGEISISDLSYYSYQPSKFEVLSLVTPYGNGLDLGPTGKTFTFDVTDFAPILKGKKRMSIELGGENQEELDIKFLFIKGTPPRQVLNIQNLWPFRRGYFAEFLDDRVFEPRQMRLSPDGRMFKLRASVTGHEQNGEFVPRNHYLNLDGGGRDFNFDVWKECSTIPIYPQGGTWIFDRAGWCPGDPTTVHQFDITNKVSPGGSVEIDYGVNGAQLDQANYLVSAQLVTYGAPSFNLDAAVVTIIRPTTQLEYARYNPACNNPTVMIQNTGATNLTSLTIEYGEKGSTKLTHRWTGNLKFLETANVVLPLDFLGFWTAGTGQGIFEVTISKPNDSTDEYPNNNSYSATFTRPAIFDFPAELEVRTNTRPNETTYRIKDMSGNVVLERLNFAANTTYKDRLNFGRGCYTFEIFDSEDDGLYYWYNSTRGRGQVKFNRVLPNGSTTTIRSFEPEFGRFISFDFVVPQSTSVAEEGAIRLVSVFPNPVSDEVTVELQGFENQEITLSLSDLNGKLLSQKTVTPAAGKTTENFRLTDLPAGVYWVKIQNGAEVMVREVVKMR